jgi:hypothetical protein
VLARAKADADRLRDLWDGGGSKEHLVGRELPVSGLEDPECRGEEAKGVRWERDKCNFWKDKTHDRIASLPTSTTTSSGT